MSITAIKLGTNIACSDEDFSWEVGEQVTFTISDGRIRLAVFQLTYSRIIYFPPYIVGCYRNPIAHNAERSRFTVRELMRLI